jgi:molybdenum cofactor cytidylyltransferase
VTSRVSAILLAAGSSKRMGKLKQLLPLDGKPVIMHCLDTIIESGITDIVVVLNPAGKEIEEALRHLPLTIVFNNDPSSEMAESVRIGLQSVHDDSSGILICLSDYPLITTDTLKILIAWHEKEPDKIIIPVYRNKRGHPNLFPKHCVDGISQGFTLREIVHKDNRIIQLVEVHDEGVLYDMDTEEDYKMIIQRVLGKKMCNKHKNYV